MKKEIYYYVSENEQIRMHMEQKKVSFSANKTTVSFTGEYLFSLTLEELESLVDELKEKGD